MGSNRDLHDAADGILKKEAIDNLSQKLQSGQRAGRCDFTEILDSELSGDRYQIILSELSALLLTTTGEREYLADQIRDGLIERYLNSANNTFLIEEEAAEIEHTAPEPEAYYYDAEEVGMA